MLITFVNENLKTYPLKNTLLLFFRLSLGDWIKPQHSLSRNREKYLLEKIVNLKRWLVISMELQILFHFAVVFNEEWKFNCSFCTTDFFCYRTNRENGEIHLLVLKNLKNWVARCHIDNEEKMEKKSKNKILYILCKL